MEHAFETTCRAALSAAAIGLALLTCAQWSTNPATPMVVSTSVGAPYGLVALSDGASGWYTFWCDKRTNGTNHEVFGQHLDADGNALWEANGRMIYSQPGRNVKDFVVDRAANGEFWFTLATGLINADTLRVQRMDADFAPLWSVPVSITHTGQGSVLYLPQIDMVPTSDGYIIGWYDQYIGGSMGVNVARITGTGELLWAPNGFAIPNASYGPFNLLPDGADGVMVNWRSGNGIGTGYATMRVDSSGVNAWPANVYPHAGAPGFGSDHAVHSAADHGMLLAYTDNTNKVRLCQVDTAGVRVFDPPIEGCTHAQSQSRVSMMHHDGITTLMWADNRPPASNQDLYMQRIDAEGNLLLASEGVLVMRINTYVPTTGVVASLDGGAIGTFTGNVTGYSAMRMSAEGTALWAEPVRFCTPPSNPVDKQLQFADGSGGVVSFWRSAGGTIYGGRIYANGDLGDHTGMDEVAGAIRLRVYPNPATDRIVLSADDRIDAVLVIAADGRSVTMPQVRRGLDVVLDIAGLPPGSYAVRASINGVPVVRWFIKP